MRTQAKYSPYAGLLNHSHPSMYFLTFNRSVWRLREEPQFLGDGRSSNARAYLPESEVLPLLSDDMLEQVMQGSQTREEYERERGMPPMDTY